MYFNLQKCLPKRDVNNVCIETSMETETDMLQTEFFLNTLT